MWMNDDEIYRAVKRWRGHAVMEPATATLASLHDWTDSHSDGWPYWQLPARSATQLMKLIDQANRADDTWRGANRPDMPTYSELRQALAPVKGFRTRMIKAGKITAGHRHDDFVIMEQLPTEAERLVAQLADAMTAYKSHAAAAELHDRDVARIGRELVNLDASTELHSDVIAAMARHRVLMPDHHES